MKNLPGSPAAAREERNASVQIGHYHESLTIEPSDQQQWLLPWTNFQGARIKREGPNERLWLVFTVHEVELTGFRLRSFFERLKRGKVEKIVTRDTGCLDLRSPAEAIITQIVVRERQPQFLNTNTHREAA